MRPDKVYILNCYNTGATPRLNAAFGQGTGPIFLDDVMCNGLETRLFDCPHRGIEVENCGHHQDAGVECVAGNNHGIIIIHLH